MSGADIALVCSNDLFAIRIPAVSCCGLGSQKT